MQKSERKICWRDEDSNTIKTIIEDIQASPILKHPDFSASFTLQTDASEVGIGAVLLQSHGIIAFFSRKLNKAQQNYTVSEKEALAIVLALAEFKSIIYNNPITIETDHSNLSFLSASAAQRCQRWRIALAEYNIKVK